jgi:hypothetical protein
MIIRKEKNPRRLKIHTPGQRIDLKPLEVYGGEPQGGDCDFVEGHSILSPTTRDRLIKRGTIVWSATKPHAGPVQRQVELDGDVTAKVIASQK